MKTNELRIGNFLNHKIQDKHIEFKSFFGLCNVENNFDRYEPITLTEDWLVRMGFDKIKSPFFGDYEYHKFINGSEYLVWFTDYSMSIGGSGDEIDKGFSYSSDCMIKYVHQLQNLYFALTGEEIKIID